jgi:hypothetical protein
MCDLTDVINWFALFFLNHIPLWFVFQVPIKYTVVTSRHPLIVQLKIKNLVTNAISLNQFLSSKVIWKVPKCHADIVDYGSDSLLFLWKGKWQYCEFLVISLETWWENLLFLLELHRVNADCWGQWAESHDERCGWGEEELWQGFLWVDFFVFFLFLLWDLWDLLLDLRDDDWRLQVDAPHF